MVAGRMQDITVGQWEAELERVSQPMTSADGWITASMFARMTGRARSTARGMLMQGVSEGRYEQAEGLYRLENGRVCDVTVYRPAEKK